MKSIFILFFTCILSLSAETFEEVYTINPDINSCSTGQLTAVEKKKVLDEVNFIRSLHNLPPVTYNENGNNEAMQAALICAANKTLNHFPPSNYTCYTAAGANGAKTSNLSLASSFGGNPSIIPPGKNPIIGWLIDDKNIGGLTNVGHRRAIINPALKSIAFGRTDGQIGNQFYSSASLKYQDYITGSFPSNIEYVAYPQGEYPTSYFSKAFYMSFHVFYNFSNVLLNNKVDYSAVSIKVKRGTTDLQVFDINNDDDGWGSIPNSLVWKVNGLQDDVEYTVEINNLNVNGQPKNYTYTFKLSTKLNSGGGGSTVPDVTTLSTPADDAKNVSDSIALTWQENQLATSYDVEVATDMLFDEIVFTNNVKATSYTIKGLKGQTTYYWRVAGKNSKGVGEWSNVFKFTTKTPVPAKISSVEPADNSKTTNNDVDIKWGKDQFAVSYDLQLANSGQFDAFSIVHDLKAIKDTIYKFRDNKLRADTKFFWRVRGVNQAGNGTWSNVTSFTSGGVSSIELTEKFGISFSQNDSEITLSNLGINEKFLDIKVYNYNGELQQHHNLILITEKMIDISKLANGVYFVFINTNGKEVVQSINIIR